MFQISKILVSVTAFFAAFSGPVFAAEELKIGETNQYQVNGGPGNTLYLSERRLTKETSEFCQWGNDVLTGKKLEKTCMVGAYEKKKK